MGDNPHLPEIVYHYCSPSGFHGIVTSKQLWLGNVHFMNDSGEQTHLIGKAEKLLGEMARGANGQYIQPLIDNFTKLRLTPYACCFSVEGDLLSQWCAYADDATGFAVGFASEWLQEQKNKHALPVAVWEIEYEEDRQMELLHSAIDGYVRYTTTQEHADVHEVVRALLGIWSLSAACKNSGFREERELRVMIMLHHRDSQKVHGISKMHFRVAKGRIVPYFTLDFPEAAIKEIRLGPKNYARDDDFYLRKFLEENGYDCSHIKIVPSEATYR